MAGRPIGAAVAFYVSECDEGLYRPPNRRIGDLEIPGKPRNTHEAVGAVRVGVFDEIHEHYLHVMILTGSRAIASSTQKISRRSVIARPNPAPE